MISTAACLLLLAAAAAPAPKVVLVDGRELRGARLLDATAARVRVEFGGEVLEIPATALVSVREPDRKVVSSGKPFNLYLHNGDRLRGPVTGDGERILLDSPHVVGLRLPLDRVRAVRFGHLLGTLQTKYGLVFDQEMARGKDVIIVQRDTKPFPVQARVLSMGSQTLTARVETVKRELAYAKVYGFVRTADAEPEPAGGVRVRIHLADGSRLTIPLKRITADTIEGAGTRVFRERVSRIEFLGDHIAHLSDFDPIEVEEVALFGEAPRWRRDGMVLGGPLEMGGHVYERGIGTQAYSRLEFVLGGRWDALFLRCGIDDTAGREGEATFRILGDGKVLHEVRRRRGEPPAPVRLDVKGVDRLVLESVPGDSFISDFCDWAEARVFNAQESTRPGR